MGGGGGGAPPHLFILQNCVYTLFIFQFHRIYLNDEELDTCTVYLDITCLFTIPQKENDKEKLHKK